MDKDALAKGYLYETVLGVFDFVFGSKAHLPVMLVRDDGSCPLVRLKAAHLELDSVLVTTLLALQSKGEKDDPVWRKFADRWGEPWLEERLAQAHKMLPHAGGDAVLSCPSREAQAKLDRGFSRASVRPENFRPMGQVNGYYIELQFPMDAPPAALEVPIEMAFKRLRAAYELNHPGFTNFNQMVFVKSITR